MGSRPRPDRHRGLPVLEGLAPDRKPDIEDWYVDDQKHVARMVTDHIAERIDAMEAQYHVRIRRWLRGTLTATALMTLSLITLAVIPCSAVLPGSS